MSSVWGMILHWGSTIKVSIQLPVATRHCHDHMTETLLKAMLNPKKQQQQINPKFTCAPQNAHLTKGWITNLGKVCSRIKKTKVFSETPNWLPALCFIQHLCIFDSEQNKQMKWLLCWLNKSNKPEAHGPHSLTRVNSYKSFKHFSLLVAMAIENKKKTFL